MRDQANGATLGHAAAASPLSEEDRASIVQFETSLSTAQVLDHGAGDLDRDGGRGGPELLAEMPRVNARFDLFDAWRGLDARSPSAMQRRRASIARGQELFNDRANSGGRTCRGCHNVANAGSSLNPVFFDVGVSAAARRTTDLPLYTMRNLTTGEVRQTSDPGRALITGRWADMDRFKTPVLRGLSAHAPYFHDGSAETIADVITHYEDALGFAFTSSEEADLGAFLAAL